MSDRDRSLKVSPLQSYCLGSERYAAFLLFVFHPVQQAGTWASPFRYFLASLVVLIAAFFGSTSHAAPILLWSSHNLVSKLPETNNVVGVADYYEAPPRIPVSRLPTSVQQRYAATGIIQCNGFEGSAQLTIKNNLITTAGHMLNDRDTCAKIAEPNQCVFIVNSQGRSRSVRVKNLVATGFRCPRENDVQDDWAVMALSEPIDDVTPYSVDPDKIIALRKNDSVVTVAHSVDFIVSSQNAKHYGECTILKIYGSGKRSDNL